MHDDPVAIARRCFDAYVSGEREALEAVIGKDFHFTSPLDNRLDRAAYFERCWPNSRAIEAFDFVNLVAAGDRVFVTYVGRNTAGKQFRNTEILTVRNGAIAEVEVYFGWNVPHDAAPGGFLDS